MDQRIADAAASCEAAVEAQWAIASLTAAIGQPLEASAAADFRNPPPVGVDRRQRGFGDPQSNVPMLARRLE
jgi:hypothetical protein